MVEVRSTLDAKKSAALVKHSLKRMIWLPLLISAFLILCGVIYIVSEPDGDDLSSGIVVIALGVLFTPLIAIILTVAQNAYTKSSSFISDRTEEVYAFDEKHITVTQTKDEEFYSLTKAEYPYLYRAWEDKNYFFLYISKAQCHIIEKASIVNGSAEELRDMLAVQMGSRFKPYKKKRR